MEFKITNRSYWQPFACALAGKGPPRTPYDNLEVKGLKKLLQLLMIWNFFHSNKFRPIQGLIINADLSLWCLGFLAEPYYFTQTRIALTKRLVCLHCSSNPDLHQYDASKVRCLGFSRLRRTSQRFQALPFQPFMNPSFDLIMLTKTKPVRDPFKKGMQFQP